MKLKTQLNYILSTVLTVTLVPAIAFAAPSEKDIAAKGIRNFGFQTFKALYNTKGKEPVAISPMSLSEALTLATQGAEKDTQAELENLWLTPTDRKMGADAQTLAKGIQQIRQEIIDYAAASKGAFEYTSANALWGNTNRDWDFKFKTAFLKQATSQYGANLTEEDFQDSSTVSNINTWVSNKTNGKITDLINKLDKNMVAILLNAIYAKGKFVEHFNDITEGKYKTAAGTSQDVSFIGKTDYVNFYEDKVTQAFSFNIGNKDSSAPSEIALDILVDKAGDLGNLVAKLDGSFYSKVVAGFANTKMQLLITPGTVQQNEALSLKKLLKQKPFNLQRSFNETLAQFSPMGTTRNEANLFMSEVLTKTFYEVTPFGFEAAAATAVLMGAATSVSLPPPTHKIDSASIHVIRHIPTGTPLFISVYDSPSHYNEAKIVELIETGHKVSRFLQAHTKDGLITTSYNFETKSSSIVLMDETTGKVLKTLKAL